MRRLVLIATAAAATLAALPAAADTPRAVPARTAARTAMDGSTVCLRNADRKSCADYQEQLLRTVGRAAAAANGNISVNDLGRRQLDALIASVS